METKCQKMRMKKDKWKLGITDVPEVKDLNIKRKSRCYFKGMRGVTSEVGGTAYYVFSDLGIEIGGKQVLQKQE